MLNAMFKPSTDNSNVKQLVSHMLSNMDFNKYQKFLQRAAKCPQRDHKFVVLEYVESPHSALVSRSERLPGNRMSIHNLIRHQDFDDIMTRLFGKTDRNSWYTRRKIDYTKSSEEQLSDIRQLVILIKQESDDEMPELIPAPSPTPAPAPPPAPVDLSYPVLNPEDYNLPSLIPMPSYSYVGSGVNQTIWSPSVYNHGYLGQRSNF